jgi:putative transposase
MTIVNASLQYLLNCICNAVTTLLQYFTSRQVTPFKPYLYSVSRHAAPSGSAHWRSKPEWVRAAVFDLALALPGAGYRSIASCFNLQQLVQQQATDGMHLGIGAAAMPTSVSKTFVAKLLKGQRAALARLRVRQRTGTPHAPIQTTWGMDLTGLPLIDGSAMPVLGIIDYGSRALLDLQPVASYNSLILLGKLLITMGTYGKPQAVRSDNDAVFKTWLFRATLALIGVRQQFTDLGSPWQNGRIERFWRTLKAELQTKAVPSRQHGQSLETRMKFASLGAMQALLASFKRSYNTYRPHQSLQGTTPAMVWNRQVKAVRLKLKATSARRAPSGKARAPPA